MSINLSFVVTFFFTTPKAVVISVCTGVGGFFVLHLFKRVGT